MSVHFLFVNPPAARKPKNILLLDVDGVLAPFGSKVPLGMEELKAAGALGNTILYRPEILAEIGEWQAEGLCEVRWLTTWQLFANPTFGKVNFGPFHTHLQDEAVEESAVWWKALHVQAILAEYPQARIAWCDDDLDKVAALGMMPFDVLDHESQLLPVCPDSSVGLSAGYLSIIKRFFQAHG